MTVETFTASNGIRLDRGAVETRLTGTEPGQVKNRLEDYDYLSNEDMDALREHFLAERDKELGRWRWPENPNYVVYAKKSSEVEPASGVRVVSERAGRSKDIGREVIGACDTTVSTFGRAARAYFAAHPEPKPWHTPKHLEIWALTIRGCLSEAYIYREGYPNREPAFRPVNNEDRVRFAPTDPKIVEAHRIWPES